MKQQQGTSPGNGCARGRPKTSQVLLTFRERYKVALDILLSRWHHNKLLLTLITRPDRGALLSSSRLFIRAPQS